MHVQEYFGVLRPNRRELCDVRWNLLPLPDVRTGRDARAHAVLQTDQRALGRPDLLPHRQPTPLAFHHGRCLSAERIGPCICP